MMFPEVFKYVLDADTFIESAKTCYSFDIALSFWEGLENFARQSLICSIDKVHNELKRGNDELLTWANSKFSRYFLDSQTKEILDNYSQIIGWVQLQDQFNQNAKDEFYQIDNADAWIIAFAYTKNLTIVTHEKFNPDIKKKVPIPNVCRAFKINYINIYQMLKELGFNF